MIQVPLQPEPTDFDALVRQPGNRLLARGIPTSSKGYKNHWKKIAHDLHRAYNGVCAYSCMYIMPPGSVDHFLPKTKHPDLAYEWSNYRLSSQRVNQHKGDSLDVIDPINVQDGWFVLDFPSCLVKANNGLPQAICDQVEKSIAVLKLNEDDTLVQERCDLMLEYAEGAVTIDFLSRRYPFLASEIVRQNIQQSVGDIFRRRI